MTIRLSVAVLIVLWPQSILPAQDNAGRFASRMQSDDKNGDGKLTKAEFTGPNRLFQFLDDDGDGVLVLKDAAQKLQKLRTRSNDLPRERMQPQRIRRDANRRVQPDFQNVRYGKHERHVFDIFQTKLDSPKPAPCMIWIHGGGFRRGDKSEGHLFSQAFTDNGIHFITLNYRLSQHALAPACFHDCARALQFIRHHAATWNIDKDRIAVGGGSAGAGMAQWLAYHDDLADPKAQDPILRESTQVAAVVLLNAQTSYDLRWIKEHIPGDAWKGDGLQQLFGYSINEVSQIDDKKYRLIEDCSPITHLDANAPPTLFFYRRSRDPEIAVENAMDAIHHPIFGLELKKVADGLGVECEVFTIENEKDRVFYNQRWQYAVRFLKTHFLESKSPD